MACDEKTREDQFAQVLPGAWGFYLFSATESLREQVADEAVCHFRVNAPHIRPLRSKGHRACHCQADLKPNREQRGV